MFEFLVDFYIVPKPSLGAFKSSSIVLTKDTVFRDNPNVTLPFQIIPLSSLAFIFLNPDYIYRLSIFTDFNDQKKTGAAFLNQC